MCRFFDIFIGMNRLHTIFALLYLLYTLPGCQQQTNDSTENPIETPPNIVFILSDDQAWTDYSFMGHPRIETPRIDQLAEESLTFTRGYSAAPLCRPSLASIITGLYPHQHGITGNDPVFDYNGEGGKYSLEWREQRQKKNTSMVNRLQSHPPLPKLLDKKGYRSLQTGKWWEGNYKTGGFSEGMTTGDPAQNGRHGDRGLKIGREGMAPIYQFLDEVKKDSVPFFLWYAPFLPHTPHNPPDSLYQKYKKKTPSESIAKYWAMCEWFDQTVGELIDALDDRELSDNTLLIYVCDNGWTQNPEGNGFVWPSKQSPYDMGIRTPIMYRWPGKIKPRLDTSTFVSSIDMVPTALAAVNLNPTDEMQGINVMDSQSLEARKTVYSEDYNHDVADVNDPTASLEHRMIMQAPWKMIIPAHESADLNKISTGGGRFIPVIGQTELYNLLQDPMEIRNVAADYPKVVEGLKKEIEFWWNK